MVTSKVIEEILIWKLPCTDATVVHEGGYHNSGSSFPSCNII